MLRGLSRVLPGLQMRQHISVHVKRDSHTRPSTAAVSPTPGCRLRVACVCGTLEASPPARCSAWGQGTLSVGTLSTRVPGVGTPSPLGLHREGGKQFSQKCRQQWRLRKQDRLPLGQPQTMKTRRRCCYTSTAREWQVKGPGHETRPPGNAPGDGTGPEGTGGDGRGPDGRGRTFLGLMQLQLLLVIPAQSTLVLSVCLHTEFPSKPFHVVCTNEGHNPELMGSLGDRQKARFQCSEHKRLAKPDLSLPDLW